MIKSNEIIILKNVSIFYDDVKIGLKAIDDVSLQINQGEFISIVGPSGCGKSTILKIISDTLNNSISKFTGEVKVLGNSPVVARKERKVGFVFQKPTLLQWRNVEGNIKLPLEIIGLPEKEIKQKVDELLKLIKLSKYAKYHPDQLSGGMQQNVSIARALAYDPEILLMDEPFGALDEINRRRMNDELIKIWQKTKKTIVFVTHSIEEAIYLSQKIVVLTKQPGKVKKIVQVGLPYPRELELNKIEFFTLLTNIRKLLVNEETELN